MELSPLIKHYLSLVPNENLELMNRCIAQINSNTSIENRLVISVHEPRVKDKSLNIISKLESSILVATAKTNLGALSPTAEYNLRDNPFLFPLLNKLMRELGPNFHRAAAKAVERLLYQDTEYEIAILRDDFRRNWNEKKHVPWSTIYLAAIVIRNGEVDGWGEWEPEDSLTLPPQMRPPKVDAPALLTGKVSNHGFLGPRPWNELLRWIVLLGGSALIAMMLPVIGKGIMQ